MIVRCTELTIQGVLPLYYDKSYDGVLNDIEEQRQRWQRPLPFYKFNVDLVILRHSEESPLPCRETAEEFEDVVAEFSGQMKHLFDAVNACSSIRSDTTGENSPYFSDDGLCLVIEVQKQMVDHPPNCHHRAYHSNCLVLNNRNTIPELPCVTKLRVLSQPDYGAGNSFANVRPVSLRVPLELVTRMPAVRELDCPWPWEYLPLTHPSEPIRHYMRPWEGPWRDARHDFGRAVTELSKEIPKSLTKVRLWFYGVGHEENDQSIPMPNLIHPADADPVSTGLCQLASHLEELDVRAISTPAIFNAQDTSWPRMNRLRVEFHPMRADGTWYFVGPRGEDPHPEGFQIRDGEHYPPTVSNDEDRRWDERHNDYFEDWWDEDERRPDMFRTVPCEERIEPLLLAFAERLKHTPTIEEAELFTYLQWSPSEEREMYYENKAEGGQPYDRENNVHRWGVRYTAAAAAAAARGEVKALVEWQVGEWRPGEGVVQAFDALNIETGVEVIWLPFEFLEERCQDHVTAFG